MNQGFYLTFGLKYGADFLAYQGDPLAIHSLYIVKILESSEIKVTDLLVYERMANTNRKSLLLAYDKTN